MQREEARQKGGTQMHNIANDGGNEKLSIFDKRPGS